jgi:tetratricopeptide (TPR) repeat protein
MAELATPRVRAGILLQLGKIAWKRRDLDAAEVFAQRCVAICQELEGGQQLAEAFHTLANVAMERAEPTLARAHYDAALRLRRIHGDARGMSASLNGLGESARLTGDLAAAAAYYREGLVLARDAGDRHRSGIALHNLGQVALAENDAANAAVCFKDGLIEHHAISDIYGIASQFAGLAGVAALQRRAECAARLFGAADRLFEEFGTHLDIADRTNFDRCVAVARGQLGDSLWCDAWRAGRELSLEDAVSSALG